VALYKCQVVIAGDFNIHIERDDDSSASTMHNLLSSFELVQHVPHKPTHEDGGTLDLVITKTEQEVRHLCVDPPKVYSDHSLIRWSVPLLHQPPIVIERLEEVGQGQVQILSAAV
jgi:hypothetical protein